MISSFATIGNYEYGFFWYLYQDGTIEFEVKLTGILSTGAVAPGDAARARRPGRPGPRRAWSTSTSSTSASTSTSTASRTPSTRCGRSRCRPGPTTPSGTRSGRCGARARDRARGPRGGSTRRRPRWWKIVNPRRAQPARRAGRLPARARRERRRRSRQPDAPVSKRAGFIRQPPVGHAVRARRALRRRRLPEPAPRRRRPAGVDERRPARRGPRRRRLVHVRPPPRAPAGGLAGDAGRDHRVHAEAGRLLRAQSRPRRAALAAARRELSPRRGHP